MKRCVVHLEPGSAISNSRTAPSNAAPLNPGDARLVRTLAWTVHRLLILAALAGMASTIVASRHHSAEFADLQGAQRLHVTPD